jgi:GT2 family glycosyltransferase
MDQIKGEPLHRSDGTLLSVVVVNYNGGDRLVTCLESLIADTGLVTEILVVDNASTDDSRTVLHKLTALHPEIAVLWSERNLGYAGAVNLALERVRGEFMGVLNMDTTVEPGWARPALAFLREHHNVGAVNPLIALLDGTRVNAVGQDIHVTGLGFNSGLSQPIERIGRAPFRVSGVQGGAFIIRRALLEKIGGMDTTGFLYHEDVNLSWLLQLMGFELYCVPEGVVYHDYVLSMYPGKLHLLERNRWVMLLTYLHWSSLVLLSPLLLLTECLVWGYCILRGWAFMRGKMTSYGWVLRRWRQIMNRRRFAESVRARSDWGLLKTLHWSYRLGQFVTLALERGDSIRQPVGGLPKEAIND